MTVEAEGGIFLVQPRILNTISHVSMLHLRPYIYIYIFISFMNLLKDRH
jgi:hypothetical protein